MLDMSCDSYQLPRHVTLNAVKSLKNHDEQISNAGC
jgi:hypothetical protein